MKIELYRRASQSHPWQELRALLQEAHRSKAWAWAPRANSISLKRQGAFTASAKRPAFAANGAYAFQAFDSSGNLETRFALCLCSVLFCSAPGLPMGCLTCRWRRSCRSSKKSTTRPLIASCSRQIPGSSFLGGGGGGRGELFAGQCQTSQIYTGKQV